MKRTYGALAVAAIALMATPAFAQIKIGSAGPMTGQYAAFGEQLQRGAEMAVEDINAAGGVNGQKLELLIGDDACDPKQATAVANKMVSDKVVFVAGHFCSGSSIPASDIYKEGKILQITPASTNPKLTDDAAAKGNTTVFRTCGRDDVQGATVGAYILKNHKDAKVAILHDKSPYGKGVADETKKALNKGGLREAMYEAYNDTDKDFTALINKMKQAQDRHHRARRLPHRGRADHQAVARAGPRRPDGGLRLARDGGVRPARRCGHRRRADVVPAQGRGRPEECRAGEEVPRRQVQPGGLHALQLRRRQGVGRCGQQGQVDRRGRGRRGAAQRQLRLAPSARSTFDQKGDIKNPVYDIYVWKDGKSYADAK